MDWFLYDNGLRYGRVNRPLMTFFANIALATLELTFSQESSQRDLCNFTYI